MGTRFDRKEIWQLSPAVLKAFHYILNAMFYSRNRGDALAICNTKQIKYA